jgi:hypothetical protein
MYRLAHQHPKDWYVFVDADVVLVDGWYKLVQKHLGGLVKHNLIAPRNYDFIQDSRRMKGVKFYKGQFISKCLHNMEAYYNESLRQLKPEDWALRKLDHKVGKFPRKILFGYHGCEQYYIHIFNMYARLYHTNKRMARRQIGNLSHGDRRMAVRGWKYGAENKVDSKDFKKYVKIKGEKKPCELTLNEFYSIYSKYAERRH